MARSKQGTQSEQTPTGQLPQDVDQADIDWEHVDALTAEQRASAIDKYSRDIADYYVEESDVKRTLSGINESLAKSSVSAAGTYWRLGKLLIAEKPNHPKKSEWSEWYSAHGLDKDRVYRAMTIAEHFGQVNDLADMTINQAVAKAKGDDDDDGPTAKIKSRLNTLEKWLASPEADRLLGGVLMLDSLLKRLDEHIESIGAFKARAAAMTTRDPFWSGKADEVEV